MPSSTIKNEETHADAQEGLCWTTSAITAPSALATRPFADLSSLCTGYMHKDAHMQSNHSTAATACAGLTGACLRYTIPLPLSVLASA